MKSIVWLGLCLIALAPAAATAAGDGVTEVREFDIYRDGSEIGNHVITITRDSDQTMVNVKTDIKVKVAFITAYRFEHERTETWSRDRLLRVESRTNDDGKKFAIIAEANGDGYSRTVNGRTDIFDGDIQLVSFWDRDTILSGDTYISPVVDETYDLSFSSPTVDKLWIGDRSYEAEHYKMSGDLDYEMWYSPEGYPLKLAFQKRGSQIEWVLK
jgi:hypothetical protein